MSTVPSVPPVDDRFVDSSEEDEAPAASVVPTAGNGAAARLAAAGLLHTQPAATAAMRFRQAAVDNVPPAPGCDTKTARGLATAAYSISSATDAAAAGAARAPGESSSHVPRAGDAAIDKRLIETEAEDDVDDDSVPLYALLRRGDRVIAQWSEDSVWYPAVILSVTHGGYENARFAVQFDGYGNTEDGLTHERLQRRPGVRYGSKRPSEASASAGGAGHAGAGDDVGGSSAPRRYAPGSLLDRLHRQAAERDAALAHMYAAAGALPPHAPAAAAAAAAAGAVSAAHPLGPAYPSAEALLRRLPAQALQLVHGAALRAARASTAEEVEAAAAEALAVVASCIHDERSDALTGSDMSGLGQRDGAWHRMRWSERFDLPHSAPASSASSASSAGAAKPKLLCAPRLAPLVESVAWHWRGGSHVGTAAANILSAGGDGAGTRVLMQWAHAGDGAASAADASVPSCSVPAAGECRGGDTCRHKHVSLANADLLLLLAVRTIPVAQLPVSQRTAADAEPVSASASPGATAAAAVADAASIMPHGLPGQAVLTKGRAALMAGPQAGSQGAGGEQPPLDALRNRVAAAVARQGPQGAVSATGMLPLAAPETNLAEPAARATASLGDAARELVGLPGASNSLVQSILASSILVPAAAASAPALPAPAEPQAGSWRERMAAKLATSRPPL